MNPPRGLAPLLLAALLACGSPPRPAHPEPPGAPLGDVDTRAEVRSADGAVLARSTYAEGGQGSRGRVEVVSTTPDGAHAELVFLAPHPPAWLALDADGDRLAFVSSSDDNGVSGLWLWRRGEPVARRVTNGGPRAPGRPPQGFLPTPHAGPPWFDGAWLRWEAPDGAHAIEVGP